MEVLEDKKEHGVERRRRADEDIKNSKRRRGEAKEEANKEETEECSEVLSSEEFHRLYEIQCLNGMGREPSKPEEPEFC